jgi:hypothetical protein
MALIQGFAVGASVIGFGLPALGFERDAHWTMRGAVARERCRKSYQQ